MESDGDPSDQQLEAHPRYNHRLIAFFIQHLPQTLGLGVALALRKLLGY